jgi:hypothetical protein
MEIVTMALDAYREIRLGVAGIRYVSDQLSQGKTLARFLLQTQELSGGYVFTLLPFSVPDADAVDFRSAVLPPPAPESQTITIGPDGTIFRVVPISHMDDAFVPLIYSYLQGGDDRLCIVEEELLRATDPVVFRREDRFVVHDDEVYAVLLRDDSEERIKTTLLGANNPWLTISALTSLPEALTILGDARQITEDQLRACAQRAVGILVGAYDAEGWVLWRPGSADA